MIYDDIKSHKKTGFHPLFRRYIFRKTTEKGSTGPPPPAVLGLILLKVSPFKDPYVSSYIQTLRDDQNIIVLSIFVKLLRSF